MALRDNTARVAHRGWHIMLIALAATVAVPLGAQASTPDEVTPMIDATVEPYDGARAPGVCRSPRPGVISFRNMLEKVYPHRNSSMSRSCPSSTFSDRLSNHYKGLALDWFLDASKSSSRREAREILDWLFEPSSDGTELHVRLRRLGITEIIWDNKIWLARTAQYSSYASATATGDWNTWEDYSTYRSCGKTDRNCRHENHIHFSFGTAGGNKTTSWWSSQMAPYRDLPKQGLVTMAIPPFGLHDPLTAGDLGLWLYRLGGSQPQPGSYAEPGHERAWDWHDDHGVTAVGSSANLSANVSREGFAEALYELDGLDGEHLPVHPDYDDIVLADADGSDVAIMWLVHTGSAPNLRVEGESIYFDPDDTITRADAMLYLHRWAGQPIVEDLIRHVYSEVPALLDGHPDAIYRDALKWAWRGGVDTDTFGDVPLHHGFFNEVAWLAETGTTQGYGAEWWTATDTFRPTGAVSRQAMAAFLYRLSGETYEPNWWQQTFSDVPTWHPFWREIEWLASTGITTGYSDGTFQPGSTVTRQAMAAFLHRLSGEPAIPGGGSTFSDVPANHPFGAQITWLADTGITTGYSDGTFGPTRTVSRQAMAAFLYRLYERFFADESGEPGTAGADDAVSEEPGATDAPSPEPSASPSPSPIASPTPSATPSAG